MTKPDEDVAPAQSYIRDHLQQITSPCDVAAALNCSYNTLRKRFRHVTGVSMGRYLQQARIDRARQLLVETDGPIWVVCQSVGYASDSSGIRAFKRLTGMTMGQYRRRYRNATE